jgi:hypothetical protein
MILQRDRSNDIAFKDYVFIERVVYVWRFTMVIEVDDTDAIPILGQKISDQRGPA